MIGAVDGIWPAQLVGLGRRHVDALESCDDCLVDPLPRRAVTVLEGALSIEVPAPSHSWVAYGPLTLCIVHARARARGGTSE